MPKSPVKNRSFKFNKHIRDALANNKARTTARSIKKKEKVGTGPVWKGI